MNMMRFSILIGILFISIFNSKVHAQDLYRNEDAPTHDRIIDLLSILSIEEK